MEEAKHYLEKIKQLLDRLHQDELQQKDSSLAASPAHLTAGPTGGRSGPYDIASSDIALKSFPGRGLGVVATRLLPAGSIILQEDATLTLPHPPVPRTTESLFNLLSHFADCSAEVRKTILSLHANIRSEDDITICTLLDTDIAELQITEEELDLVVLLDSIFFTNNFEDADPDYRSLYLQASRFNHSCLPNCDYGQTTNGDRSTITIRSNRDIQPGQEITVTYLINWEHREKRRAKTKRSWGVVCNCPACNYADPTVDTIAHEVMLLEYRRLRQDPLLWAYATSSSDLLSSKDFDAAAWRSTRRAQIAFQLGDIYGTIVHNIIASGICRRKWLWLQQAEDLENQILFLEGARFLLNDFMPASYESEEIREPLEETLRRARNNARLNGILQIAM